MMMNNVNKIYIPRCVVNNKKIIIYLLNKILNSSFHHIKSSSTYNYRDLQTLSFFTAAIGKQLGAFQFYSM